MIIHKILNNNVVVTLNENSKEQVIMGKGIAFKKKVGDLVLDNQVDQIFYLTNSATALKFQELLEEVSTEVIEISYEITKYAKKNMQKKLNDTLFISLVDHLNATLQRKEHGIEIKNFLLWDIKRFFSKEFQIACKAVQLLEKNFSVEISEDEAGFIALHLVNSEWDERINDMYGLTKMIQEINSIIKYHFKISFDEESVYFYRFITHLKFFVYRLLNGNNHCIDEEDEELYGLITKKYINASNCVEKIEIFLFERYDYTISKEEKIYLIIHIEGIIQKNR